MNVKLAALLCLLAQTSLAGLSTNAWPSYLFPRQGKTHILESHTAAVERCHAAGVTTPDFTTLYRNYRTNLVAVKSAFAAAIPNYANTNLSIAGDFDEFYRINPIQTTNFYNLGEWSTNGVDYGILVHNMDKPPAWTVTGLCVHVGAPTNFFDYTPYRDLSGCGALTNDASVGHPYGFTNEYTAIGGDMPASRTSDWYTTDYGYGTMDLMINELRWTTASNNASDNGTETTHTNLSAVLMADALSTNVFMWDNNRYENGTFPISGLSLFQSQLASNKTAKTFTFRGTRRKAWPEISGLYTGATHSVDLYRTFSLGAIGFDVPREFDESIDTRYRDDFFGDIIPAGSPKERYFMSEQFGSVTNDSFTSAANTSLTWTNNPLSMVWPTPPPDATATNWGTTYDKRGYFIMQSFMVGSVSNAPGTPAGLLWAFPGGASSRTFVPGAGPSEGIDIWIIKWDGFVY